MPITHLLRRLYPFVIAAVLLAMLSPRISAQICPGRWIATSGIAGTTYCIAPLSSGDLLIGGEFDGACSVSARNIVRFSPATNTWSALGSGITDAFEAPRVSALLVLPSGDVLVGGQFRIAGGVAASNIARYSPASNTWSALGAGTNGPIASLALLSTGDVIIGGAFTTAGPVAANCLARLNPSTGLWSPIGSGVTGGAPTFVNAIVRLPGDDFIIGGEFSTVNGAPAARVARFNAVASAWSTLGAGLDGTVNAMLLLPGGDLIVGGTMSNSGATPLRRIARWSASTSTWLPIGLGIGSSDQFPSVRSLALLPSGDVIIGGEFTKAGPIISVGIARLTPATNTYATLGIGLNNDGGSHPDGTFVYAIAPTGSDVYAAGVFEVAGSALATGIARFTPATSLWSPLGAAVDSGIQALLTLPSGEVVAGGDFASANSLPASRIARHNPATNLWTPYGDGLNGSVLALANLPTGDLIAAGTFTVSAEVPLAHIARWTDASAAWSTIGAGMNDTIRALAAAPNNDIIAGGDFATADAAPAAHIARWDAAGSTWLPLGPGLNGPVYALARAPTGDIFAAGAFSAAGSTACANIARWDAATSAWLPLASGLNARVNALLLLPNGDLIAAGEFTASGSLPLAHIARWNPATAAWSAMFIGMDDSIYALALAPSGAIIAGGAFTHVGLASTALKVARWDNYSSSWYNLNEGVGGSAPDPRTIRAIAALPSGDFVLGGTFSTALNYPSIRVYQSPNYVRWSDTPIASVQTLQSFRAPYNATLDLRVNYIAGYTGVSWQWFHNGVPVVSGPGGASPGGGTAGPPLPGSGYGGPTGTFPTQNINLGAVLRVSAIRAPDAGLYTAILTSACGTASIDAYNITVGCPGDYNNDGILNTADIFTFLSGWFNGDLHSRYHDGVHQQVQDVFDFLDFWFHGC